jgi:hypothetical protein
MRSILLLSFTCLLFLNLAAQRNCTIKQEVSTVVPSNGTLAPVPAPDVIIIPVVVHVIYNNASQNISNDQIRSQIVVLNKDFRLKNSDAAYIPAAFKDLAADTRIEFRLATIDPSGLSTEGIIRKSTAVTAFGLNDHIKSSINGGDDPWNRDQYLNIWVGNLSGGTMGYASVPGAAPEKDGVVISYTAFGTTANVKAPFNKGRTTVHEVGHWLGLRHIWGDADCGDDRIEDTPPQAGPTRGCPSGVIATCSSGSAGNMYMNFMDFTNDECTNMFTHGQAGRMRELFQTGGARVALLTSDKAEGAVAPEDVLINTSEKITIYPNPAVDKILLRNVSAGAQVCIYNQLGQITTRLIANNTSQEINVAGFKSGMYYVSINGDKGMKFLKH